MKRRDFIKVGAIGGISMHLSTVYGIQTRLPMSEMPRRVLGRTGEKLSVVGFGSIALRNNGQDFANETVAEAFDLGIDYFDVAPAYGNAQDLLGPALEPYRKKVFLACKTAKRDKAGSEAELHESLKLLRTDHFDLYQFHALSKMEDLEQIFASGGAIETFEKARKDGRVKYLGFSAHNEEVALKAMEMFDFDSILYPINCVCWLNGNFGPAVLEKARSKDMGVLALKAVAKDRVGNDAKPYPNMWYKPFEDDEDIIDALRFTLAKDITATVHAGDVKFMMKTLKMVRSASEFLPPEQGEIEAMIKGVKPIFDHPATV
jgi:predicted aldo/keto reductase-like oxidoreductase